MRISDGRDSSDGVDHSVDAETTVTVEVANQAPVFGERGYSYTITSGSDGSVDPVVVGTPSAVDPEMQTLTYSLRASDPADRMYMLGDDTDALHRLDSTTGAVTERVGTAAQFGVGETDPRGLAWHNGRLYMTGDTSDSLYTLDVVTGEATRLTSGGVTGSLLGVASHDGNLYVTTSAYQADDDTYAGRLYRVDLDTSTFTQIGNTNLGVAESWPKGLASHGSPAQVYMLGTTNNALYTLDTDTGVAVRVGTAEEFGVGEHYPFGLASHNGVLYMTGSAHDALYTLDTITGEATRIGAADEFDIGEKYPSGLASGYREPEGFAINSTTGEITYTGTSATSGTHTLYAQVTDNKNSANTADNLDSGGSSGHAIDATVPVTITVVSSPLSGDNSGKAPINQPPPPGDQPTPPPPIDQSPPGGDQSGTPLGEQPPASDQSPPGGDQSGTPGGEQPPAGDHSETPGGSSPSPGNQSPVPPAGQSGGSSPPSQGRFTDIAGLVHEQNIAYIAAVGITVGCDQQSTRYCPHDFVTRAQMASFLARAFKLRAPSDPSMGVFRDVANSSHGDSIRAVAAAGITLGCDPTGDYYCPEHFVTRAQMASFLAWTLHRTQ